MPKMKWSWYDAYLLTFFHHKSTIAIAAKPVSRLGPGYQRKNVYSYFIQRKVFLNINNFCTSAGLASYTGKMAERDFLWKYTLCPTKTSAYTFKTLVELCNYHKKSSNVYSLKRQRMKVEGKESLMEVA